jgi:hypothetical protein
METLTVRSRFRAEMGADRLADVGQRLAPADRPGACRASATRCLTGTKRLKGVPLIGLAMPAG